MIKRWAGREHDACGREVGCIISPITTSIVVLLIGSPGQLAEPGLQALTEGQENGGRMFQRAEATQRKHFS